MQALSTIRDRIFGPKPTEAERRAALWPSREAFVVPTSVPKDQLTPRQKADLIHRIAAEDGRANTVHGIIGTIKDTHIAPHGWPYDAEELELISGGRVPTEVLDTILDRGPRRHHVPVSDQHLWVLTFLFGIGSNVWRDVDLTPYRDQPNYLDDFQPPFTLREFSR